MKYFTTGSIASELWSQAVDVARKERRFLDVTETYSFLDQSINAKPAAAMLRKAILERLKVVFETFVSHIETSGCHLLNHLFIVVFSQWNGRDFEPTE